MKFNMRTEEIRLRILFIILVGVICYSVADTLAFRNPWIPALAGGWIATIVVVAEQGLTQISIKGLIAGILGLGIGLIIANLIAWPIRGIAFLESFAPLIFLLINGIFATVGLTVFLKRKEEIADFLLRRGGKKISGEGKNKIVDTSVIIDGRIVDLCKTGFIEGTLVIPHFILEEVQQIADSSTSSKRTRGRRGLDMVNELQSQERIPVQIVDTDFPDIPEVDSKLLQLAKVMKAQIITNDFNLKKVAKIQEVEVLNINEIATALKPVLLPGESLRINVLKEGENPNQGVAYLEDGTMVVIEKGKQYIGKQAEVIVTSVLQTTTGKMIFTELREEISKAKKRKK